MRNVHQSWLPVYQIQWQSSEIPHFSIVTRSNAGEMKTSHGGVALYKKIDPNINFNIISNDLYDMIVAEIQDTNFIMVVTYIPPNNTKYYNDIYFDHLRLVTDTFQTSKNILIFGDLNSRIKNNFPNNGLQYQLIQIKLLTKTEDI